MSNPSTQPPTGSYPVAQQQPYRQPQQPVAVFDQGARFDPNNPPTIPVSVLLFIVYSCFVCLNVHTNNYNL